MSINVSFVNTSREWLCPAPTHRTRRPATDDARTAETISDSPLGITISLGEQASLPDQFFHSMKRSRYRIHLAVS